MQDFQNTKTADVSYLNTSDVFVFIKPGCPFCHQAVAYIQQKYKSDETIKILDIYQGNNMKLFNECADREGIPSSQRGTPLICFPNDAMLGWSEYAAEEFDSRMQRKMKNTQ